MIIQPVGTNEAPEFAMYTAQQRIKPTNAIVLGLGNTHAAAMADCLARIDRITNRTKN